MGTGNWTVSMTHTAYVQNREGRTDRWSWCPSLSVSASNGWNLIKFVFSWNKLCQLRRVAKSFVFVNLQHQEGRCCVALFKKMNAVSTSGDTALPQPSRPTRVYSVVIPFYLLYSPLLSVYHCHHQPSCLLTPDLCSLWRSYCEGVTTNQRPFLSLCRFLKPINHIIPEYMIIYTR